MWHNMWLPGRLWLSSEYCVFKCGWSRVRALLMRGIAHQKGRVSVLRMPAYTQVVPALKVIRNQLRHSNQFCKPGPKDAPLNFSERCIQTLSGKVALGDLHDCAPKVFGWALSITVRHLNESQGKDIQDKAGRKGWSKWPEVLKPPELMGSHASLHPA